MPAAATMSLLPAALLLAGALTAQGDEHDERGERLRAAIEDGLRWLAAHQDDDGRFSASLFAVHDPRDAPCDGVGKPAQDVYVTALAVRACYGVGSLPGKGEHGLMVTRALDWLCTQQRDSGWFCPPALPFALRNHVAACQILARGDSYAPCAAWQQAARRGIEVVAPRALGAGGLPHTAGEGQVCGETSTWFESARLHYGGTAEDWSLELLADLDALPVQARPLAHSAALLSLTWHGERRGCDALRQGRQRLLGFGWDGGPLPDDARIWYFGAQAMQFDDGWPAWSDGLVAAALPRQRRDGSFAGSWDPDAEHGRIGGRVYATAMTLLAIEVAWRKDHRDR